MNLLNWAWTHAAQLSFAASIASALLPAPKPGSFGAAVVALINLVGVNVGHAGNATPAALKTEQGNTSFATTLQVFLLIGVLSAMCLVVPSSAQAAGVNLTCAVPTVRLPDDNGVVLALPASELAGIKFYLLTPTKKAVSGLQPGCSYVYPVPTGTCVQGTDQWAMSAVDTAGQEGPLSPVGTTGVNVCTPKPGPAAPSSVKATPVP